MRKRHVLIVALAMVMACVGIAEAASVHQDETSIYGWIGTIYAYSRPAYDDYFVRIDGELYGITGRSALVEQRLELLRGKRVKIWGALLDPAPDFNGRQIVVSDILETTVEPTATPLPPEEPEAVIEVSVANLRTGPSTAYPRLTYAYGGQRYDIVGRNADSTWWQICCPASRSLWIYADLAEARGDTKYVPIVAVTPLPTPTPAPVIISEWRGEYYSNAELTGTPSLVRNDAAIDFNWGDKSPAPALPTNDFSARWTRSLYFPQGNYRFYANADDGVRVWLDDWLLIDRWTAGPVSASNDFGDIGEGSHTVRIEYFEHLGNAAVNVWWQRTDIYRNWRGEYYHDIYLQPPPAFVREDPEINFYWGLGSPGPGLGADNFSVRWTRTLYFDAGDYRFYVRGGDGVRLRLDGWLIIDNWLEDTQHAFEGQFDRIGSGQHSVEVEWYSRGGIAEARVSWDRITRKGGPQPD